MAPLHPPLPTAMNFPFHPDAGIHTSILMSESADGFSVAATRQNAGRSLTACTMPGDTVAPAGIGGLNAPASTACATVIVVVGSASEARLSHDRAAVAVSARLSAAAVREKARAIVRKCFMPKLYARRRLRATGSPPMIDR